MRIKVRSALGMSFWLERGISNVGVENICGARGTYTNTVHMPFAVPLLGPRKTLETGQAFQTWMMKMSEKLERKRQGDA